MSLQVARQVFTFPPGGAVLFAAALLLALGSSALAQEPAGGILDLSLEDLLNVEVTSVSRRAQALRDAPSAIHVATAEDIRRTGATSIPEALRIVPGVQVSQLDSSRWAVSIRGFNNRFNDKLLVMIDGRSVYTPVFSGVYWEAQDIMIEDIERIEVIRGPGGAMWGSNAVNGVINIITKAASETQGGLLSAWGGTQDAATALRYGGKAGDGLHYRVNGRFRRGRPSLETSGQPADDRWGAGRAGARVDWNPTGRDQVEIAGGSFEGRARGGYLVPTEAFPFEGVRRLREDFADSHLRAKWSREVTEGVRTTFALLRCSKPVGQAALGVRSHRH